MKTLHLILIGLLFSSFSATTLAKKSGIYIGFDVGASATDYYDDELSSVSNNSVTFSADTDSAAFRLFGGVMLNDNIGIQLSVVDFGTYQYTTTVTNGFYTVNKKSDIDTIGVYSDLVLQLPIANHRIKFFGELGVGFAMREIKDINIDDNGSSFHVGGGIKFSLNEYIDLQAGAHKYFIAVEDESGDKKFGELSYSLFAGGLTFKF